MPADPLSCREKGNKGFSYVAIMRQWMDKLINSTVVSLRTKKACVVSRYSFQYMLSPTKGLAIPISKHECVVTNGLHYILCITVYLTLIL